MSINSTSGISAASQSAAAQPAADKKTLNQQDFLTLLVAQLSSQDPMNPQSNSDFAAQMAQFSALQSSQASGSELANIRSDQQVLQATGMIGRAVTLDSNGTTEGGIVSGVVMNSGSPQLLINDQLYNLSQVLSILSAPQATAGT